MKNTWMVVALALSGLTACTSEVGELLECAQVCESYDDCVADSADQTGCTGACEDYADRGEAQEDQVFACDDCMNELGDVCDSSCNDICAGVIPPL
jgi:hypothetical protein